MKYVSLFTLIDRLKRIAALDVLITFVIGLL